MRKRIILKLTLAFSTVLLISCSTVKEGVVISKHYNPPRTVYASGVANQRDAEYYIKIKGENKRGMLRNKRVYLSKSDYKAMNVGDYFGYK